MYKVLVGKIIVLDILSRVYVENKVDRTKRDSK